MGARTLKKFTLLVKETHLCVSHSTPLDATHTLCPSSIDPTLDD